MRLAHISDIHFCGQHREAIEAVRQNLEAEPVDGVVVTGDITADGQAAEFAAAFDWFNTLPAPVLVLPGNHDTPYFNLAARAVAPFARYHKYLRRALVAGRVRHDPWRTDDFAIAPINTARGMQLRLNWALGAISRGQSTRAARVLAPASPNALRIVATHHPLIWPEQSPIIGDTRGGARAMARLVNAGARLFLSGHLHASIVATVHTKNGAAISVSAGTLSARLRGEPPSFNRLSRALGDAVLNVEQLNIIDGAVEVANIARMDINTAEPISAIGAEVQDLHTDDVSA